MSKRCVIFSGGQPESTNFLKSLDLSERTVISADAGYLTAKRLGVKTDVMVGDFDTLKDIPNDVAEIVKFKKEKDDTDTMLASRIAIERGFDDVIICCALGGRLDHLFANIQTLAFLHNHSAKACIISENEQLSMLTNSTVRLVKRENFSLSLFAYGGECRGVTLKGVKYPLNKAVISCDFPIGVCNEITEDFADISVENGTLLIITSKIQNLF